MITGRMPACVVVPLVGDHNASVPNIHKAKANKYYPSMQVLNAGNRCGHDPKSPRVFQEPTGHKVRPYLIVEGRRRLRSTYYNHFCYDAGKMAFHKDKTNQDGVLKKVRSERRSAITHSVGEALLHYANISAMAVGFTDAKTGKFINIGITKIATKTGCSYQSTRKALKAFEEAGAIVIEQTARMTSSGNIRNNAAYIHINKKFFYDLGFDDIDIQHYKSKQQADLNKRILEQKRTDFKHKKRVWLKTKNKEKLAVRDSTMLDKEQPGWRRSYQEAQAPLYKDYTGIAKISPPTPSPTTIQSIKSILARLNSS